MADPPTEPTALELSARAAVIFKGWRVTPDPGLDLMPFARMCRLSGEPASPGGV